MIDKEDLRLHLEEIAIELRTISSNLAEVAEPEPKSLVEELTETIRETSWRRKGYAEYSEYAEAVLKRLRELAPERLTAMGVGVIHSEGWLMKEIIDAIFGSPESQNEFGASSLNVVNGQADDD